MKHWQATNLSTVGKGEAKSFAFQSAVDIELITIIEQSWLAS